MKARERPHHVPADERLLAQIVLLPAAGMHACLAALWAAVPAARKRQNSIFAIGENDDVKVA